MSISLITLARNNIEELGKTANSIASQTRKPEFFLVLDSSEPELARLAKKIAEGAGAEYVWTRSRGIYSAMRQSLDLVPQDSYSWWLNSSDWFAGTRSVEIAFQEIASQPVPPAWLVGKLIRLSEKKWRHHDSGSDGQDFIRRLSAGKTGLPHPSTLFWTPYLREVGAYEDGFSIASDYGTALRFARNFGPPLLSKHILAVQMTNGISSRRPMTNLIQKSRARLRTNQIGLRWREPFFVVNNVVRGAVNTLPCRSEVGGAPSGRDGVLGDNSHFCNDGNDALWPRCCSDYLGL